MTVPSGADRAVVVLGSGAAGLAAGLAAAERGAAVTVIERASHLGGTTAISGGGIWIPANPWRPDPDGTGGPKDAARAVEYLAALQRGDAMPELAGTYVREGARVARAVEALAGVEWQHLVGMSDYHAELPGGSGTGRSLEIAPVEVDTNDSEQVRRDPYGTPPWTINEEGGATDRPDEAELARRRRNGILTRGRGLVAAMVAALRERGGQVRCGAGPSSLLRDGRRVVGVEIDGEQLPGDVVIATGGFERDPSLVAAFLRGPILAPAGPPTNRGDGLRMGMSVGAALGNMSEAWWCPAVHVGGEQIDGADFFRMLFLDPAKPGGLVVDRHGRRFANEATNYNDFGRTLVELDPAEFDHPRIPSWLVFDAARHRESPLGFLSRPEPDGRWLIRADSVADLADRIDVDRGALAATIDQFAAGATTVDAFGRGSYVWDRFSSGGAPLRPLDGPPFYAARILPGCLGTKGGLRTDEHGRVLRADGDGVIDGLFAAGNAAANPFGCAYPGPGATIGPALVFGTLAGETAAAGS